MTAALVILPVIVVYGEMASLDESAANEGANRMAAAVSTFCSLYPCNIVDDAVVEREVCLNFTRNESLQCSGLLSIQCKRKNGL